MFVECNEMFVVCGDRLGLPSPMVVCWVPACFRVVGCMTYVPVTIRIHGRMCWVQRDRLPTDHWHAILRRIDGRPPHCLGHAWLTSDMWNRNVVA